MSKDKAINELILALSYNGGEKQEKHLRKAIELLKSEPTDISSWPNPAQPELTYGPTRLESEPDNKVKLEGDMRSEESKKEDEKNEHKIREMRKFIKINSLESEPEPGEFTKELRSFSRELFKNRLTKGKPVSLEVCRKIEQACDRIDRLEAKNKELKEGNIIMRKYLDEATENRDELINENERLHAELKAKDEKIQQLQAEIDACRAEIERLERR